MFFIIVPLDTRSSSVCYTDCYAKVLFNHFRVPFAYHGSIRTTQITYKNIMIWHLILIVDAISSISVIFWGGRGRKWWSCHSDKNKCHWISPMALLYHENHALDAWFNRGFADKEEIKTPLLYNGSAVSQLHEKQQRRSFGNEYK